ncbi:glutathione S-transferase T3-like [Capsella rubella]|uniref:glutathione S-transferase T3-like n=1 Tax=Capsella rubella TaxID=81985 RepID=UPI000CD52807|nr:glutathione S-transferase T3-like [Capsella rubella]
MDSNNPYGGSPGYFSLNNFPYENFSQNVNFGSTPPTQFQPFSQQPSQGSQNPSLNQNPSPSQNPSQTTPNASRERRQWNTSNDLVLISGWLNTSNDVIVGNDQRSGTFWKRISDYYGASEHVLNGAEPRRPDHCKQRWGRINKEVSHLCGAYGTAEGGKSSGMNDVDVLKNAHTIYMSLYKKKFRLEHAWVELRQEHKWCSLGVMNPSSNTSSKRMRSEDAPPSSGSVANEPESRAEGVKAMKGKRFRGKDKAAPSKDYPQLWENKQKDNEAKKELQKMSILDTLLAKTQPLDEDELALMNNFMAELFYVANMSNMSKSKYYQLSVYCSCLIAILSIFCVMNQMLCLCL